MNYETKFTLEKSLLQALNSKFSEAEMAVANYFFSRARSNPQFRVSYETIASQTKIKNRKRICRETVRRAINKLIDLNLLKRIKEKFYMGACEYRVNVLIFKVAASVKDKFKSLLRYLAVQANSLWKPNVAPLYKYSNIYPRKYIVVDNQSQKNIKRGNFLTKREDMEISPPNISPTLREITNRIGLTKLGQLKLLVIPEDILSSVWSHFKKQAGVNKPFEWILANCLRRCENLGIAISWELFYLSVKRYGLVDNKIYVSKINKVEKKVIESSRSVDNIIRPYQDKTEPHPKFAQFYFQAMDNTSKS